MSELNENNSINIIWDNCLNNDEHILKHLNNLILDHNQIKENLAMYLLISKNKLPIKSLQDIKKLFNIINSLNNKYDMGSNTWECKNVIYKNEKFLFIKNSVSRLNHDIKFKNFINLIKNKFKISDVEFNYFELTSSRFNKTVDIIFVFNYSQFT
jgi:hypothetical protein